MHTLQKHPLILISTSILSILFTIGFIYSIILKFLIKHKTHIPVAGSRMIQQMRGIYTRTIDAQLIYIAIRVCCDPWDSFY